jgi:Tol biopolymer transport system component
LIFGYYYDGKLQYAARTRNGFTPSSREQHGAKYSPDGTQIVFDSNRTGNSEIWVSDADGSNEVQLTSFGARQTGSPNWSPDGKRIAFDPRRGGEATIYIVDPRGGVP